MANRKNNTDPQNVSDNQTNETETQTVSDNEIGDMNETLNAGSENTDGNDTIGDFVDGTRTDDNGDEDEDANAKREALLATAFTMESIPGTNFGELGQFIWDKIPGEKWDDRFDNMQSLITAMRVARDNSKPKSTRESRSVEDVIRESIGKPMSDLQAVKVKLMTGVNLPIPAIIRLAEDENSPIHGYAVKFLNDHKIKAVAEKKGSRGKASIFLRNADYEVPAEESEGEQAAA